MFGLSLNILVQILPELNLEEGVLAFQKPCLISYLLISADDVLFLYQILSTVLIGLALLSTSLGGPFL